MGLRLVRLFLFAALFGGCTRGVNESYIALYTDCSFELTDTGRRQTTGFQDHFSFVELLTGEVAPFLSSCVPAERPPNPHLGMDWLRRENMLPFVPDWWQLCDEGSLHTWRTPESEVNLIECPGKKSFLYIIVD